MIEWLAEHWDECVEVAGLVWVLVSIYVALTPSKADDAWLRRVAQRLSFLGSRNDRVWPTLSPPGARTPPPEPDDDEPAP